MSSPIADLSYRSYDGPRLKASDCWKVILKNTVLSAVRKRIYWVVTFVGSWYFLALLVIMFFLERVLGQQNPEMLSQFLKNMVWSDQLLLGFTFGQLSYLFVTILVGSGALANDRRSNALLVYLSKPVTTKDYVLGKFLGTYIPVLASMALPGILFYAIGALSYSGYGFLKDLSVLPKMLLVYLVASFFFTSLIFGIGALSKHGRIVSAAYAGIYFICGFLALVSYQAWNSNIGSEVATRSTTLARLTYAGVDGMVIGFAKSLLRTDGSLPFARQANFEVPVPFPPLWLPSGIILVVCVVSWLLIMRSVRAVEVIK